MRKHRSDPSIFWMLVAAMVFTTLLVVVILAVTR